MADTEISTVRLEDGEIDESNEPSASPDIKGGIAENDLRFGKDEDMQMKNGDKNDEIPPAEPTVLDVKQNNRRKSLRKAHFDYKEVDYIDEDEMLCVRGASPVAIVVERPNYRRKSQPQDSNNTMDTTPPKRRRTTGKRRSRRLTPKKSVKGKKSVSNETRKSTSKEISQSPQEVQEKLPQICKFYLQDTCAKRSFCEYMHSEFPCKFYYMGLKCEDEMTSPGCKLSHGGLLSSEMLENLTRHIHTAPVEVLGQEFVGLISTMTGNEISGKLQQIQDSLRPPDSDAKEEVPLPENDSLKFIAVLREKLFFLNEKQLNELQQLGITKADDLLNLTLAQLNGIGIHAGQVEAIQMSLAAGQDIDMRSILPTKLETPMAQVPSFEIVCFNEVNTYGQNWYEEEERTLVIDETNADENKIPEDDGIIIDVLGDSNSESNNENEIKVNIEFDAEATVSTEISDVPESVDIVEEIRRELQVLPNSEVSVESLSSQCPGPVDVEETEKEQHVSENMKEVEGEAQQIVCLENIAAEKNLKEIEVVPNFEVQQEEIVATSPPNDQDEAQNVKNTNDTSYDNLSVDKDVIEKQLEIEAPSNAQEQMTAPSPTKEIIQSDIHEDNEQIFTSPTKANEECYTPSPKKNEQCYRPSSTENENRFTPSPKPIDTANENRISYTPPLLLKKSSLKESNRSCSPPPEQIVAKIDLTVVSPPRKHIEQHIFNSKERYSNPFHRKIISPVKERKRCYSPVKGQSKHFSKATSKQNDHKMQDDNSSEDWDADERSDIQSPSKEIASPDQSEDESTSYVADVKVLKLPERTKNLENYQPATEINAHLTYPPMEYKLFEMYMPEYEINKPTQMDKLLKAKSTDPRLKRFIEKEKNHGVFPQAEYSFFPPNIPQCDPRPRRGNGNNCLDSYYNASRILYSYLQSSRWYQELKSNLKIQINHSVSDLVRALNYFHQDPSPQKIFDLFQIECAGVLLEVMRNVGIFIDANGNITEEANYKQLCVHMPQQQPSTPSQAFGNMGGCAVQYPKPGLLGFAPPGVPHPNQRNTSMSNENSFARQAFGSDCFCNNNEMQPNVSSFYVGNRYGMNQNTEPNSNSGFEQGKSFRRQHQKRNFNRH